MIGYSNEQILEALDLSHEPEIIEAAKQFYRDNGYAFTANGKHQALTDLDIVERPLVVRLATGMALALLSFEELKGEKNA